MARVSLETGAHKHQLAAGVLEAGRDKWLKFEGDTEHYVKPFKGTRYTLVYYHWA